MKQKFATVVQGDFASTDVVTIATQSQLRLNNEMEAGKAKAERDAQVKQTQKARMNALFARLVSADQAANPGGCLRPRNPFRPTGESIVDEVLDSSPTTRNIVDWTTAGEARGRDRAAQLTHLDGDSKATMKI